MERDEVVVKVRELMTENLVSVESEEIVIEAARLMDEKGISSVLVKYQGDLVGIITDRDIITRILSKGLDAAKVRASEVMSSPLITVEEDASVEDAAKKMAEHSIRRLVVAGSSGGAATAHSYNHRLTSYSSRQTSNSSQRN